LKAALRHPALHWVLGIGLGGVFVYASLDKIAQPAEFAKIVYHYRLLGPDFDTGPLLANLLSVTLPWVELLAGLLLISGVWRREAALATAGMLVMFLGAVPWALLQGIDLANCGCFSVAAGAEGDGRRLGIQLLVGDLGLLLAALVLAFLPPRPSAARASADEPAQASA
jgi:uncharacterized membrane protein YphA (DoxX/SURF4 family)